MWGMNEKEKGFQNFWPKQKMELPFSDTWKRMKEKQVLKETSGFLSILNLRCLVDTKWR